MSTLYTCQHHGRPEYTYRATAWHVCGCDGTTHLACHVRAGRPSAPRPADWPTYLTWPQRVSRSDRDVAVHVMTMTEEEV